ncbi:NAD-dependent epimerase/dehydratase family protein [Psychromonas sp. KJ10-10]|uniref:NAD-dependent epimerase/dehydratase family protein n=1 Tax=Psychromonas sp. KJ10-10 TaxID=3391823 RepID=UPI0039B67407
MKILINGSSGLIGTALVAFLQAQGYQVGRLLRYQQDQHPYWDIDTATFHLKDFCEPDIVINLAGENIGDGRWTKKKATTFR